MNNTHEEDARPNVIWIFGDQHRAQALGCAGDPNVNTPNIDRLSAEGVSFDAVAGCPLCCPARGSLLTGKYPHECVPGHQYPLPEGQETIADVFNAAGYHTGYIGKWHLDGFQESTGRAGLHIVPPHRRGGFKTWIGYENNNSQYDCWVHGGEGETAFQYRLPGYETDELTNLFIQHLRERAEGGEPFFAALSVQPPHDPYVAGADWMGRHNPATVKLRPNVPQVPRVEQAARRDLAGYYGMIENLDWNIGRIREVLWETGLWESTHIVFFSDHGDMHGSHGQFKKTAPWEEAIRVPFIIAGGIPYYGSKGGRHAKKDIPLNMVDIAPTTLGLCGIEAPDWMRGADLSGFRVQGKAVAEEPDSAFLQLVIPTGHGDSIDRPWRAIVTRDGWKYAVLEGQPWLMFNLNEDPYEQVNLAHNSGFGAKRKALQARLQQWMDETGDDFLMPAA